MYNHKQRFFATLGVLFFLILSIAISYAGIDSLIDYLKYEEAINFSIWSVFAMFFPTFSLPFLVLILPVIFYGEMISVESGRIFVKISCAFLILTVICMVIFSSIYTSSLTRKGYVPCKGTPIGWTPGMAKRYTTDQSVCNRAKNNN